MKSTFEAMAGLTGAELVALARSTRDASPPVSTPALDRVRAVSDASGRAWRVEGPGWTMAPIGIVSAAEAEGICRAAAAAVNGLAAGASPARG